MRSAAPAGLAFYACIRTAEAQTAGFAPV